MSEGRRGLTLAVWVSPGAKRTAVTGVADGRLRLRLAAPAIEGRANDELVRFLAKELGVPRRDVSVAVGGLARRKLVRITGVTLSEAEHRLGLQQAKEP